MRVNLFDATFAHDVCSVAGKKPKYIEYVRGQMQHEGLTIFTDGFISEPIVDEVESKWKIGWLHEPQCLHPHDYVKALINRDKFDMVLTYYEPFLRAYPGKFKFCPYGGIWIDRRSWGLRPKTKLVSMLYGAKRATPGHILRHEISAALPDGGGLDFYGARGTPVGYGATTKLQVLGDHYFSIVVEACNELNLFTEILLDCFAVGTIPIFWGAMNISNFFNPDGILQFNSIDELKMILTTINPGLYNERAQPLHAVQDNLVLAEQYEVTEDWMYKHVLKDYD